MLLTQNPELSVLMPVYNCEKYLAESIRSILEQSFKNFELIIINDGSKDGSGEVAKSFADPRIRYFEQENRGLANTLNRGLSLATAEFIARQDQDDVSTPERFAQQLKFFKNNPQIVLLGTAAEIWSNGQPTGRILSHPLSNRTIQGFLCFDNSFVHSSVMFRKSAVLKVGAYRAEKKFQPEDYDLWCRLAREYEVANLPDKLLIYREVSSSMSRVDEGQFPNVPTIAAEQIWNRFWKTLPRKWLEDFSKQLRYQTPFSKKRAIFYLFVLGLIGTRYGFDSTHVKPQMKRCFNRLGFS